MSQERAQPIRPTQFITTYGPGAILETLRGPRLIYGIGESGLFDRESPLEYEIVEPALSSSLPEQGRIFRLPCNADRDCEDSVGIYGTLAFPMWSLCTQHNLLYRRDLDKGKACPKCPNMAKWKAWEQAGQQAVSFVFACPDGHLDEVPWVRLLHPTSTSCRPTTIEWKGAGGPLRGVTLVCPDCGTTARLSDLYHRDHACSGRFPEDKNRDNPCQRRARLSQRGASDLFLPEVRSALTLPQVDSDLHKALRHSEVRPLLDLKFRFKAKLDQTDWLEITGGRRVPDSVRQVIMEASEEQRAVAARQVAKEGEPTTGEQTRAAELRTLLESSRGKGHRSPNFELDTAGSREFPVGGATLRVTPVTRLRMVAAQTGYTRLSGSAVTTGYRFQGDLWFPGVEQFGEGLFLELEAPPVATGPTWRAWEARFAECGEAASHPLMVWWHTLSHRLIRALSVDSGYSAAAVRERLYLDGDVGGLLIYAVQPGGDGTLGGLVALVPRLSRILHSALGQLDGCSNDPLCGDQRVSPQRANGAACYACSLLSETSCEMRNLSLDRRLMLETLGL